MSTKLPHINKSARSLIHKSSDSQSKKSKKVLRNNLKVNGFFGYSTIFRNLREMEVNPEL